MLLIKLSRLIIPLLLLVYYLFWVVLAFILALSFIMSMYDGEFSWSNFIFFFGSAYIIVNIIKIIIEKFLYIRTEYKLIQKNYFLDTYVFPRVLYKTLSEEYPHLNKNELEEVLEAMKVFYRFQIEKRNYKATYMPSHVIDFASQIFFNMDESSLFFKKVLPSQKKYTRTLPIGDSLLNKSISVLLSGQHDYDMNSKISDMWCYCCKKEKIDPFFPLIFPSFFTLDKRLRIPSGFLFELDETLFRDTHRIINAMSISDLKYEIQNVEDIDYLAKKIQYFLGEYLYCNQYQEWELKELFELIDKNQSLTHAVYGKYSDVNLFITTVLNNAAPPPPTDG